MTVLISINIDSFHFALANPCLHDKERATEILLSFKLDGDFLPGAISDQLSDTVDYEALCQQIKSRVRALNCDAIPLITAHINHAIIESSPLITSGWFSLSVTCHSAFTTTKGLDIKT